jgi:hypothetical protein
VNYTAAKELRGGGLRGPFHALLRRPELADRVRFVQRSAHQSQACLTLATNGVEIGNSRFLGALLWMRSVRSEFWPSDLIGFMFR